MIALGLSQEHGGRKWETALRLLHSTGHESQCVDCFSECHALELILGLRGPKETVEAAAEGCRRLDLLTSAEFAKHLSSEIALEFPDIPAWGFIHPVRSAGEWVLSGIRSDSQTLLQDDVGLHEQSLVDRQTQFHHWIGQLQTGVPRRFLFASHRMADEWGGLLTAGRFSRLLMTIRDPGAISLSLINYALDRIRGGASPIRFGMSAATADALPRLANPRDQAAALIADSQFREAYRNPLTTAIGKSGATANQAIEFIEEHSVVLLDSHTAPSQLRRCGLSAEHLPEPHRTNVGRRFVSWSDLEMEQVRLIEHEFVAGDAEVYHALRETLRSQMTVAD